VRGALNVAAIPEPAPAAIKIIFCWLGIDIIWPSVDPSDVPI
jgi:hypothetical protein